jgi:enoyl-CoA hydratase
LKNYETLKVTQSGEVLTIALNRPKLNLFNEKMIRELTHAFLIQRENVSIRFIILTAIGENFSAGIDLKEFGDGDFSPIDARKNQLLGHDLMHSIENLEQVTVASLRGIVCGAGMAVSQACDFRIMSEDSYFIVPETQIGTYYTWGCTPRLVRMVGASKAMEIIMTCDAINAEQAYRLNLANKIVKSESLGDETKQFIEKIASKSPTSVRITKKIVQGASMVGFGNMLPCEPELMQGLVYTGETNEGISAFLNRKPPNY